MISRMRILDGTLLALEAEGMRPTAARAAGWRRAVAGCGIDSLETLLPPAGAGDSPDRASPVAESSSPPGNAASRRSAAPERPPSLSELIARVLPTTVVPSVSALANLASGAFPQSGWHCIYGLGDALFADRKTLARSIDSLSEGREALLAPCFTNERGCATALAVEWLLGGEDRAALVSFAGCGGLAALEEVLAALLVHGGLPAADLRGLPELTDRYRRMGGGPIPPAKAVIGEAIFSVESGIHVDGLWKSPDLYELFPPEIVGRERRIIMGKHSGKRAVLVKCGALGLPVTADLAERVLQKVKEESARRKTSLCDTDFIALYSTCRAGKDEKEEGGRAVL
ncbi:MAG: hypothetical protein LBN96_06695 [Desulfovibrio sp.]|jgi:hypothetical protein|nr:hypothetical protein [Desulfovibrio sp.]